MRTGPSRAHRLATTLRDGSRLRIACQVTGQLVSGHVRRTARWDRLAGGRYVSDANVAWRPARPRLPVCGARNSAVRPARIAVAATGGIPLNVRTGPTRAHPRVTTLRDGARLRIACQVTGQLVSGHVRRTARWDRLVGGRYVSDANVSWRPAPPAVPVCRVAPARVPATPAAFIRAVAGPARQSMRRYRVPASVTIAQAILESGWGRSELSTAHRNYFGIKCFGTPGPIAVGCASYPTTECERSHCWRTEATFRVYRSLRDSVRDHGRFLVVNPRYRPAFAYSRRADRFAVAIHRAGYATAPGYARAIIMLMRQYRLYRYDR